MTLSPTKVRRALLTAVAEGGGRIYLEHSTKDVRDKATGFVITARLKELVNAGWVVARPDGEPRGGGEWSDQRTYYRLTDEGRAAMNWRPA